MKRYKEAAAAMLKDGGLEKALDERYNGWQSTKAQEMLANGTLESIAGRVLSENIEPKPRSGRQEILENYVNRFV